jgi:hypothetical protein
MPPKIPADSTVATVWPHLAHPRQYVAGIRHKMMTCAKSHGNAFVRIGITGTGQMPCYRIFHQAGEQRAETIYGSYWDTHDPLEKEDAVNANWSTASMSFEEIDALLKEKINWKKKT